jgi:alanine racemase
MTSAHDLIGRTHPILRVSRSAVAANLSGHPREVYADARHDGWGLGAELITAVAREQSLAGVVDDAGPSAFAGEVPPTFAVVTAAVAAGALPQTRPAVTLSGEVLSVKVLRAGESVSYGYTFTASEDTRVALVTGGYAQGIVRSLGNRLAVTVNGDRRPIVGRVAMDVCVVDVGASDVAPGSEVVFLGDPDRGEPAWAEWISLTGLGLEELLPAIGNRARREVVA